MRINSVKLAAGIVCLFLAPLAFGQQAKDSKVSPAASSQEIQAAQPGSEKAQTAAAKPASKISPEKQASIQKLFEVVGTRAAMEKVIAGMTDNMKPMLSQVLPPGDYQAKLIDLFFQRFRVKLKVDDLMELSASIYDKYFSKEDIDALVDFYKTPLGKKVQSVLPQVLIESQTAGMKMGEQIGQESMAEVLAENPELAKAMQEAARPKQ